MVVVVSTAKEFLIMACPRMPGRGCACTGLRCPGQVCHALRGHGKITPEARNIVTLCNVFACRTLARTANSLAKVNSSHSEHWWLYEPDLTEEMVKLGLRDFLVTKRSSKGSTSPCA
jgi:hypothetical protein